jgi:hypothetical protein
MTPTRYAVTSAVLAALALSAQACSSAPIDAEQESVGQSQQAMTMCKMTLTCCVTIATNPTPWDLTNPFEAQLAAWKCTNPRLYQPNQATNAWWYWSQCTDPSQRVEGFLASHPEYQAAPYLAVTSTTLDKACVATPPAGSVDVLWDPTCPTCRLAK